MYPVAPLLHVKSLVDSMIPSLPGMKPACSGTLVPKPDIRLSVETGFPPEHLFRICSRDWRSRNPKWRASDTHGLRAWRISGFAGISDNGLYPDRWRNRIQAGTITV